MYNPDVGRRITVVRRNSMLSNSANDSPQLNGVGGHASSPYVPNFLFGSQSKRRSLALPPEHTYAGLGSSIRSQRYEGMNLTSTLPSCASPLDGSSKSVHWSPALVTMEKSPQKLRSAMSSETPTKLGPPLRSIREELDQMKTTPIDSSYVEPVESPTAMDTSSAEQDESANWVMVYGFAPGDAAEVIKIFSRHGIVVAKKLPEEGNWIYLRYTCPIHAQQALSRNAQVFNSRMRLGVLPVKPEEIATFGDCSLRDLSMRSERENLNARSRPALNTSSINSPLTINKSPLDTSYRPSRLSNASRAGIRSLSAAYSTADNDYRVDAVQQPVKNTSLINKLWGYIS